MTVAGRSATDYFQAVASIVEFDPERWNLPALLKPANYQVGRSARGRQRGAERSCGRGDMGHDAPQGDHHEMSATELPLVYLTFANSQDAHLALLKAESRDIYEALVPLEKAGRIAIQREESSERKELYDDLVTNGDRLVVFHYGGHANGTLLQLEDGAESAVGLARLLGQMRSLKLVFLNGCATQGHAALLRDAGVPAGDRHLGPDRQSEGP